MAAKRLVFVTPLADGKYSVKTSVGTYTVKHNEAGNLVCNCPRYQTRGVSTVCKHMKAVQNLGGNGHRKIVKSQPVQAQPIQAEPVAATVIAIPNGNKHSVRKNTGIHMQELVPTTDDGYIARRIGDKTDLKILEIAYNNRQPVLVIGETGSGKSLAVTAFGYRNKLPVLAVNLNGATSYEELVGQFVPDETGSLLWQDGILTTIVRQGGILLLNEINVISSELNFVINGITERNKSHRKLVIAQTAEIISAHPDLWVVATMNEGFAYEGTKPLNVAFADRFGTYLNYEYDENIERKLGIPEKLMRIAKLCRESTEIEKPVSTAALVQWTKGIALYGEKLAAELCFINKFRNEEERKVAKELCDMVLYNKQARQDKTIEADPAQQP